jgi:ubiquinone/menaquinone biosynthesis C-methylase UbiE
MNLLRKSKRFFDKVFKAKSDELFWKFRHIFQKSWPDDCISEISMEHPHRKVLIQEIAKFYPFKNVLEIGSASGANLFLLARRFPEVKFYGIDINAKAVEAGKKYLKKNGIKNVFLRVGNIMDIKNIGSKSMEVVFSDAVMMYIGNEKLNFIIKEMSRVAEKVILLCEHHTDQDPFYDDRWVHNYKKTIESSLPEAKVSFTKITEDVWGGDWAKYGHIIKIVLYSQ